MLRVAPWTNSCSTSFGGSSARAGGAVNPMKNAVKAAMADVNRPHHGRAEYPLLRIVSGMPPFTSAGRHPSPAGPSRANRESLDFTLKGNRAERVQIVNATTLALGRRRYC